MSGNIGKIKHIQSQSNTPGAAYIQSRLDLVPFPKYFWHVYCSFFFKEETMVQIIAENIFFSELCCNYHSKQGSGRILAVTWRQSSWNYLRREWENNKKQGMYCALFPLFSFCKWDLPQWKKSEFQQIFRPNSGSDHTIIHRQQSQEIKPNIWQI